VSLPMPELLAVAERIPTFAGIKYTNSDLAMLQECIAFGDGAFDILFGTDEALMAGLALGARGAVGSTYNFAAPIYHHVLAAFDAGDLDTARVWQQRSVDLVRTIAAYGYSAAAKSVMAMIGVDCGPARIPLVALDESQRAALRRDLEALGFFEWIREDARSAG
jgi:N-acetylneuraminate lyase